MTFERIVVTGATGNTGSAVIQRLVRHVQPASILALVRAESDTAELDQLGVLTHICDLALPGTYANAIPESSAFVGISNLRHTDAMMPTLQELGVKHAFCVTTTAVFSGYHSYSQHYRDIEARLRSARITTTLLRPSMIYGNLRDHNMHKLIRVLDKTPVFPVFGPGTALMQPVHVEDLADGIVASVLNGAAGEYNLAGPTPLPYNDILATVADALGKTVRLLHVPHGFSARIVRAAERIPRFPVTYEQVMRLLEDKAFDIEPAIQDLGYRPRSFANGISSEVNEYRQYQA